jgi:hypothetical protein
MTQTIINFLAAIAPAVIELFHAKTNAERAVAADKAALAAERHWADEELRKKHSGHT